MAPRALGRSTEVIEQGPGFLEVRGVEALGEPVVNLGEPSARLAAMTLLSEQPSEAGRCTKFPCLRTHAASQRDRVAEIGFGLLQIRLLKPDFATNPECLGTVYEFFGIKIECLFYSFECVTDGACLKLGG